VPRKATKIFCSRNKLGHIYFGCIYMVGSLASLFPKKFEILKYKHHNLLLVICTNHVLQSPGLLYTCMSHIHECSRFGLNYVGKADERPESCHKVALVGFELRYK
jgi:hypothetical protein